MRRAGLVLKSTPQMATVLLQRHSACGACKGCRLGRDDGDEAAIEVVNKVNAQVGDQVLVEADSAGIVHGAFWAYGLPLLLWIISIALAYIMKLPDTTLLVMLTVSLVIAFGLNKYVLEPIRNKKEKYSLKAVKIISNLEGWECHVD